MQIPYTFARREFMLWPTGLSGYVPVSSQEMEMFEIQLSEGHIYSLCPMLLHTYSHIILWDGGSIDIDMNCATLHCRFISLSFTGGSQLM